MNIIVYFVGSIVLREEEERKNGFGIVEFHKMLTSSCV